MSVFSLADESSLERYATLAGCTVAQLKHAIESVGEDEPLVREFLQTHDQIPPQHPVVLTAFAEQPIEDTKPE